MSINPFENNQNIFTQNQTSSNFQLNNKNEINLINSTIGNNLQNDAKNSIMSQKINSNPFNINIFPTTNNSNIAQNENNKNNKNSFLLLKTRQTQQSQEPAPNINMTQNIKNNTLINNNNNNINQNSSNIFNNPKNTTNITDTIKPSDNNITFGVNNKEVKKEESNIFLSQSNNILNKLKNNNENQNKEQVKNSLISLNPPKEKNEILLPNPDKKENPKVNDFINNLFEEDKIVFTEEEKKEFEKKQLSIKSGEEIIDEFRFMLFTQKEKFLQLTNNARLIDNKLINLLNNIENNSYETLNNQIRYNKLLEKVKLAEEKYANLQKKMNNKNNNINNGLDYLKKNLDNKNNLSLIKKQNFEEKNMFYKEMSETSDKISKINNNLNSIWFSMNKNQIHKNEITDFFHNEKNGYNNIRINNKNMNGIFIETKNNDNNDFNNNKIYVEQKDINNIFNECYDGLYSLKCMQDEFDVKFNNLKNKLIDKSKEKERNNFGNIYNQQEDLNL